MRTVSGESAWGPQVVTKPLLWTASSPFVGLTVGVESAGLVISLSTRQMWFKVILKVICHYMSDTSPAQEERAESNVKLPLQGEESRPQCSPASSSRLNFYLMSFILFTHRSCSSGYSRRSLLLLQRDVSGPLSVLRSGHNSLSDSLEHYYNSSFPTIQLLVCLGIL